MSASIRGQGHSAGQKRTEPEPHQLRAALMKGRAASKALGLGRLWLNWSNEIQRDLSVVRYQRTEQDRGRGSHHCLT